MKNNWQLKINLLHYLDILNLLLRNLRIFKLKNKKPDIFILPQFSTKIGYGHLKRSLVLYELLKKYYRVRMIYFKNRADVKVDYIFFQSLKNLINYLQQENPLQQPYASLDWTF